MGVRKRRQTRKTSQKRERARELPFVPPSFSATSVVSSAPLFFISTCLRLPFPPLLFQATQKSGGRQKETGRGRGEELEKKSPGGRNPSFFPSSVDSSPIGIGLVGWWRVLFPPPPFSHGPLAASPPFSFSRSPPSSSPPFMDERAIRKRKRGNWTEGGGEQLERMMY